MRLMNVCPFKVGDVVRCHSRMQTLVDNVEWDSSRDIWLLHWKYEGRESYWVVNPEDPDHSGIRLVKRGDE